MNFTAKSLVNRVIFTMSLLPGKYTLTGKDLGKEILKEDKDSVAKFNYNTCLKKRPMNFGSAFFLREWCTRIPDGTQGAH